MLPENPAEPQPKETPDDTPTPDSRPWYKLVGDRVSKMPSGFVDAHPEAAARLASSTRIPDDHINRLSQHYGDLYNWASQRETFAGIQGATIHARLKAINAANPMLSQRAHETIDAVQSLNPADQQLLASYAKNPQSLLQDVMANATVDVSSGGIQVNPDQVDAAQVAAVEHLFPQLQGKIHFEAGGLSLNDLYYSSGDALDGLYHQVLGLDPGESYLDVFKSPGHALQAALGAVSAPFTIATTGYGYTGQAIAAQVAAAESHLPEGAQAALDRNLGAAAGPTLQTQSILGSAPGFIGRPAALLMNAIPGLHVDENSKEFKRRADASGGIILAVALHVGGEGLDAAKVVGSTEATAAAANLGVVTDESGVGQALDSIRESYNGLSESAAGRAASTALHPIRVLVDPAVRTFIYNMSKVPAEDFVQTSQAGRFFDAVDTIAQENPATAAARIQQRYMLDPELAQRLLDAGGRDQMPDAYIDYIRNAPALDPGEAAKMQTEIGKLQKSRKEPLTEINAAIDERTPVSYRAEGASSGMGEEAANLDQEGNKYQEIFDYYKRIKPEQLEQIAPNIYKRQGTNAINPQRTYYYVDEAGKVVAIRDQAGKSTSAFTAPSVAGTGIGTKLGLAHMADIGVDTPEAFIDYVNSQHFTPEGAALDKAMGREMFGTRETPPQTAMREARIIELQGQLSDGATHYVDPRFPGGRDLKTYLHRVWNRPMTTMERAWGRILSPVKATEGWSNKIFNTNFDTAGTPWLGKWTDKVDFQPTIFDGSSVSAPKDWVDQNQTVFNRYLGRLGFNREEIAQVSQRFMDVKSKQDFYKALENMYNRIDTHLPVDTPLVVRKKLTTFSQRTQEEFTMYYRDPQTGVIEPLVPGRMVEGSSDALPAIPNEFINGHKMPNLNFVEEATSSLKRWARNEREGSQLTEKQIQARIARTARSMGVTPEVAEARIRETMSSNPFSVAAADSYEFTRAFLHSSTSVLKPWSLRLKIPAIILRKTIDEAGGNQLSPNMVGGLRPSSDIIREAMGPTDPSVIGSGLNSAFEHTDQVRFQESVSLADLTSRGLADDPAVWSSRVRELQFLNSDPVVRAYVQTGLDPEAFAQRLQSDPELKAMFDGTVARVLPEGHNGAGMDITEYLTRLKAGIEDMTLHDPALLDFVKTGRVYQGGALDGLTAHRFGRMQTENAVILKRINEIGQDPANFPEVKALQRALHENINRMKDISDQYGDGGELTINSITSAHEEALAKYIHERWDNGDLQMPQNFRVDRFRSRDAGYAPAGIIEHLNQWATDHSTKMYSKFKPIGDFEAKWAKGSFYEQRAWQYFKEQRAMGVSKADAIAWARIKAGNETRDMFYDLSARSSIERSTRNVFWYAPVTAELAYRWFYGIPSQYGLIPGLALNTLKAINYFNLLKNTGVIHKDVNGQWVLPIPGAGTFLDAINSGLRPSQQIRVPSELNIPLISLSHLTFDIPSVSTPIGFTLSQLSKHSDVIRHIAQVIDPYGESTEIIPSAVRYAAGVFGIKLPDLNNDYIDSQYNSIRDQALQYAVADLAKSGYKQPLRESFSSDQQYLDAWTQWHDRVNTVAQSFSKGMYFVKLLQSTVIPGTVSMSSPEKDAYTKFFTTQILPQYNDPSFQPGGQMSAQIKAQLLKWYASHPESAAFGVSYAHYTGKVWHPPATATTDEQFRLLYLQGVKDTMDPAEYSQVLAAMMAKNTYDAKQNSELQRVAPDSLGPDQQAATLLTSWGTRRQIITDRQTSWNTYLHLHPEVAGLVKTADARIAKQYGFASESDQLQWIQDTLLGLAKLAPTFTGESGMTTQEYNAVVGNLRAEEVKYFKSIGGQQNATPLARSLSWYFGQITEYNNQVKPLYDEAARLTDAGQPAGGVYSKITQIKNQYSGLTRNGITYPSIDAFYYGTKTTQEQNYAKDNWATKPISWLSDFQRQTLGYATFTNEDEFWGKVNQIDSEVQQVMTDKGITASSNLGQALTKAATSAKAGLASQYGPVAQQQLALENASPATRLSSTGFGSGDQSWSNVVSWSAVISQRLQGQQATAAKIGLYNYIQAQEQSDPQFQKLMTELSYSIPAANSPDGQRIGAALYEAIFFGNFSTAYIAPEILAAYQGGNGGV